MDTTSGKSVPILGAVFHRHSSGGVRSLTDHNTNNACVPELLPSHQNLQKKPAKNTESHDNVRPFFSLSALVKNHISKVACRAICLYNALEPIIPVPRGWFHAKRRGCGRNKLSQPRRSKGKSPPPSHTRRVIEGPSLSIEYLDPSGTPTRQTSKKLVPPSPPLHSVISHDHPSA